MTISATEVLKERLIPLAEAYATLGAPEVPRGLARTIHTFPEGEAYVSTLEDLARKGYEERLNALRNEARSNIKIFAPLVQRLIPYYEGRIHSPFQDYTSVIPPPPKGNREEEEWISQELDFPIKRWDKHYSTVKSPWSSPFEQFLIAWETALEEVSYLEYAEARVERLYALWAGKKFEEEKERLSQPKSGDSSKPLLDLHKREDHLYALGMMLGRLTFDEAASLHELFVPLYEREGGILLERLIREGKSLEEGERKDLLEGWRGAYYSYRDMKRRIQEPFGILKEYYRRGGSPLLGEGIKEVESLLHSAHKYHTTRMVEETVEDAPYTIKRLLALTEEGILEELIARHPPDDPLGEQLAILRETLERGKPYLQELEEIMRTGSERITTLHERRKGRKDDEYVPLIFYTT